ncbi:MAG TPA: DUF47 family protein [Pyrodictiaceae archaeon]|nr:DUF47 family protein [Pyrodictiaceae archaeon]HIP85328.1 DUF47 family protein [Pyrodictium sp.]HIQ55533.1 DUF47 family protein [Pyrodictium sp.]
MSDYLDYASDEKLKMSLAELSLSEQLLGLARHVEDIVRETAGVIEGLVEGKVENAKLLYERINGLKNQAEEMKDSTLTYIARLGVALDTATYYKNVALALARIAQLMDGAAYRAKLLAELESKPQLSSEITKSLKEAIATLLETYSQLLSAIRQLSDNPRQSIERAKRVVGGEERMDTVYRGFLYTIYKGAESKIGKMLLLRDLIDFIEEAVDTARNAAEDILFLAMYRAART